MASTLAQALVDTLASDGENVYWSQSDDNGAGSVVSVSASGGAPVTLGSGLNPECIAIDETSVYWTDVSAAGDGVVMRVAKAGGSPTTLAAQGSAQDMARLGLVVDATSVYWVGGSLMKIAKGGGVPVTLSAPTSPSAGFGEGCGSLAIGGDTLFLMAVTGTSSPALDIVSVPVAGAAHPKLVAFGDGPYSMVANASDLFWTGLGSQLDVNETSLVGDRTKTLAMPLARQLNDIALASDGTLYWQTDTQVQSIVP